MKPFTTRVLLLLVGAIFGAWAQREWLAAHPAAPPGTGKNSSNVRLTPDAASWRKAVPLDDSPAGSTDPLTAFLSFLNRPPTPLSQPLREALLRHAEQLTAAELSLVLMRWHHSPLVAGAAPVLSRLWSRWAELDPASALAASWRYGAPLEDGAASNLVLTTWARLNLSGAFEHLQGLAEPRRRHAGMVQLLQVVAGQDPREALRRLESVPRGRLRLEGESAVYTGWAAVDPVAAADSLASPSASVDSGNAYIAVAEAWGQTDPEAAFRWAKSLTSPRGRTAALGAAFLSLADAFPERAATELASLPKEPGFHESAGQLAERWARRDPAAATAWVTGLPEGPEKPNLLPQLLSLWGQTDPQAAAAFLAGMDSQKRREFHVEALAMSWANQDPLAALAWAEQLPHESERTAAVAATLAAYARLAPEQAIGYAQGLPAGEIQERTTLNALETWTENNPAAAAAWATQLPEGSLRQDALGRLARTWGFGDAERAADWLGTLAPGRERDGAIEGYVSAVDGYDPRLGTLVATTMSDEERRWLVVGSVAQRWIQSDPAAARAWIDRAALPEVLRDNLRGMVPHPPSENPTPPGQSPARR